MAVILTLAILVFFLWLCFKIFKFALQATWGILKVLGYILMVIACPILFVGIITIGLGLYIFIPFMLVGLALMLFSKVSV